VPDKELKNKTMKLKTFLIGAGLMLGLITGAIAQTATQDSVRLRIMKDENGVVTNIDTTVVASQHGQLLIWLSSQGVELPPSPPHMKGDTLMKRIIVIETEDSIGGGERMMRIPMPPPPPGEPLPPPHPPGTIIMRAPAPPPGHEGEMMIIVCDTTMKTKTECRKVIVNEKAPGSIQRTAQPKAEMKANELVIYPNPSQGNFTLEINMPGKEKAELLISDINGKIVYSEQITESNEKITKQIDLSKYGKGMYSIRLSKGGKVVIENVVVE
jgi:hypothetical protein